jgi:hypothetical protein
VAIGEQQAKLESVAYLGSQMSGMYDAMVQQEAERASELQADTIELLELVHKNNEHNLCIRNFDVLKSFHNVLCHRVHRPVLQSSTYDKK